MEFKGDSLQSLQFKSNLQESLRLGFLLLNSNRILNVHHSTMDVLRHPKAPVNIPRTPSLEFGQGPEGLPNSDGRYSDDLGEDVNQDDPIRIKLNTLGHSSKECQVFVVSTIKHWRPCFLRRLRSLGIWLCSSCAKTDKTCTSPWTPPKGHPRASKRGKAHVS